MLGYADDDKQYHTKPRLPCSRRMTVYIYILTKLRVAFLHCTTQTTGTLFAGRITHQSVNQQQDSECRGTPNGWWNERVSRDEHYEVGQKKNAWGAHNEFSSKHKEKGSSGWEEQWSRSNCVCDKVVVRCCDRKNKEKKKRERERNRLERLRKSNVSQSIILFGRPSVPRHVHVSVQFIDDAHVVQFVQPLRCVRIILLDEIFDCEHCALL